METLGGVAGRHLLGNLGHEFKFCICNTTLQGGIPSRSSQPISMGKTIPLSKNRKGRIDGDNNTPQPPGKSLFILREE
jgi:hypothetical protein